MSVFPCQQREHQGVLQAEEARESKGSEERRVAEGGGGVLWWLWDAFLGAPSEVKGSRSAVENQSSIFFLCPISVLRSSLLTPSRSSL